MSQNDLVLSHSVLATGGAILDALIGDQKSGNGGRQPQERRDADDDGARYRGGTSRQAGTNLRLGRAKVCSTMVQNREKHRKNSRLNIYCSLSERESEVSERVSE